MISRGEIVQEAQSWKGTRWQHQASVKGVACDCIGLVRGVARHVGFADPFANGQAQRFAGYGTQPDPRELMLAVSMFLDPIKRADATLGDILVFRFDGNPMHFGIISNLEPLRIVHGWAKSRKVTENGIDIAWANRITSAHRYKELA